MIVDNFEIIEKILNFEPSTKNESIYYQIDLIERKKDGVKTSGCQNSARRITSFYPENWAQWLKYKHRIIDLCDARPGLRAYINPSRKLGTKILKQILTDVADRMNHDAITGLSKFFPSAIAKTKPEKEDSIWLIDVDADDEFTYQDIIDILKTIGEDIVITLVPSRSGMHILTHQFNRQEFAKKFNEKGWSKTDFIQVNALTNLYINATASVFDGVKIGDKFVTQFGDIMSYQKEDGYGFYLTKDGSSDEMWVYDSNGNMLFVPYGMKNHKIVVKI